MNKILLWAIAFYQKLSPIFGARCRYFPSCSQYAKEALLRYCFPKAFILVLVRLLRCNPFARGGYDPLR